MHTPISVSSVRLDNNQGDNLVSGKEIETSFSLTEEIGRATAVVER